ncbi:hypothetical protein ABZ780_13990 [Micromonospora sp. NPDC047467]|uniref:hypothetical protein n=1 Tax=Micromonospora sp. NPDC047467 TaxID=3154814 RepID=UPI0033E855B5
MADLLFLRALMVVGGCLWSAFDGPVTAQTAQGRPKSGHPPDDPSTTSICQSYLLLVIDQLQILYEDLSAVLGLLALLALIAV